MSRRKRDQCPKLELHTSHGCRPCSLCDPNDPKVRKLNLINPACKNKHGDTVIVNGSLKPWCDNANGPFPECPSIPAFIRINCTDSCRNHDRSFAPDCECQVDCPGQQPTRVFCNRDLKWSGAIPAYCPSPSTTTTNFGLTTTSAGPYPESTVITFAVVGSICSFFFVGLIAVAFLLYYWRWQKKKKDGSSSCSSSSQDCSSSKSEKSYRTDAPLISKQTEEKVMKASGAPVVDGFSNKQASPQSTVVVVEKEEEKEEEETSRHTADDRPLEAEALLGGAADESENALSWKGLQALLRDFQALCKMTKLFDHKDRFDRVTWHTVAVEFAGWDADKIHSVEYMLRPSAGGSPGDGFIYQVLTTAHQSGKGLLELLEHLNQRQHFKHPEAESFLWEYWEDWKQKNAPGN